MKVRVRPAAEREYAVAGAICVAAYRADGQLGPAPDADEASPDRGDGPFDYSVVLADAAGRAVDNDVLVAVGDNDTVLGCVTFVRPGSRLAELSGDGEAEFRMLAVAPTAQGLGVGSALVQACIDRAAGQDCHSIVICVRDFNEVAKKLYAKFGFVRMPDRDFTPVPDVVLEALRLDLG
jgi:ribosomal protein S18 acetylase RimI-like enzyme